MLGPDDSDALPKSWIAGAIAAALVVVGVSAAGAREVARHNGDLMGVIGQQGDARAGRRVYVGIGAVANNAGTGGDALTGAAHEGIESALTARSEVTTAGSTGAQRGARTAGPRGHFIDANIQSVQTTGESTRATVSVVVSSHPAREYEFESTSTITLTGSGAVTPEGQADCVRRAMRRATDNAVNQITQSAR